MYRKGLQGPISPEMELQRRAAPISQCPQTSRMRTLRRRHLTVGLGSTPAVCFRSWERLESARLSHPVELARARTDAPTGSLSNIALSGRQRSFGRFRARRLLLITQIAGAIYVRLFGARGYLDHPRRATRRRLTMPTDAILRVI